MNDRKLNRLAKKFDYEFIHVKETTSTMKDVKNFLNNHEKNCIVLSDMQTEGRGQRGNIWHSPLGNIYCSVSFSNLLKFKDHFMYNVLMAVSIKLALEYFDAKDIKFKWPNDLFYKKKKFSGMISEIFKCDNLKPYIISGFGINIFNSPDVKEYPSTYAKAFCNIKNIESFLEVLFEILFLNIKKYLYKDIICLLDLFKSSLMDINEDIKILLPDKTEIYGKFKDINNDGSLILEFNGITKNIYNGRIRL